MRRNDSTSSSERKKYRRRLNDIMADCKNADMDKRLLPTLNWENSMDFLALRTKPSKIPSSILEIVSIIHVTRRNSHSTSLKKLVLFEWGAEDSLRRQDLSFCSWVEIRSRLGCNAPPNDTLWCAVFRRQAASYAAVFVAVQLKDCTLLWSFQLQTPGDQLKLCVSRQYFERRMWLRWLCDQWRVWRWMKVRAGKEICLQFGPGAASFLCCAINTALYYIEVRRSCLWRRMVTKSICSAVALVVLFVKGAVRRKEKWKSC